MTADMRTTYLGLDLANPIVPSASPLGQRIDTLRRLEDAGIGESRVAGRAGDAITVPHLNRVAMAKLE